MLIRVAVLVVVSTFAVSAFGQTGVYIDRNTNNNDETARANARRAAVTAAQGEVDRAQAAVEASIARVRATWKANPELINAERELATKQAAYDKARAPVVEKLKQDPEYRQAADQAAAADAAVKQEQAMRPPTTSPAHPTTIPVPSDTQVQAATEKLQQKSTLREMEEKAIAADPAAAQAKAELDAARERIKALNLQFDAIMLNDPEHKSAVDALQAARSRLTAASGQY